MRGIVFLTNSSDFLQKSNNFENMRTMFLVMGILFLIISIVLFIRFDIRQIIFINVKHKQKNIPKAYKPDMKKMKSGREIKGKKNMTENFEETALLESVSEETVLLENVNGSEETTLLENEYDRTEVLDGDKTEVLDEVQLEFHIEKNVEMYSDGAGKGAEQ